MKGKRSNISRYLKSSKKEGHMSIQNLHELFLHELRDLYSAESQIIKALPVMISKATDPDLRLALGEHLEITKTQLERLDTIAEDFDFLVQGHECLALKGLIKENEETLKEITDPATKDAAIIIGAQRIEHYEIAVYGGVAQFARDMDHIEAADLLETTLQEESDADEKLSSLAEGGFFSNGINEMANENEME